MAHPDKPWLVLIPILLGVLVTCSHISGKDRGFKKVRIELPPNENPLPEREAYTPPKPYGTPMRNWWGTKETPVVWPE